MSVPSKVPENYGQRRASKLLSAYQTSQSKPHLNMQTGDISRGWRGVKIKRTRRGNEIGALTRGRSPACHHVMRFGLVNPLILHGSDIQKIQVKWLLH